VIYDDILKTIGKTPIVGIQRLAPRHVTLYVKCEFFNPAASVKDRLAIVILAMLPDTGERYLSMVLFEGIADGGDPEP
jgi:cysteine synthase